MNDNRTGGSFWTTLPGVLSGFAALVTALVAAYAIIRGNTPSTIATRTLTSAETLSAQPDAPQAETLIAVAASSAIASRVSDAALAASFGEPVAAETGVPGGGQAQDFLNGSVYWHSRTGAWTVQGAIRDKYRAVGATTFGYPTTDELTAPDRVGRFNVFSFAYPDGMIEERSIYWRPDLGAHTIQGLIRAKWKEAGWERGPLGYPVSDEYQAGPLRRQDFEHGRIDWSMSTGAQIVMR